MDSQKKLTRPRQGRMLAGVCAGLGNYFGIDPTLVRVVYAVCSICTALVLGIIIYVAMLLIIPEDPSIYSR